MAQYATINGACDDPGDLGVARAGMTKDLHQNLKFVEQRTGMLYHLVSVFVRMLLSQRLLIKEGERRGQHRASGYETACAYNITVLLVC